MRALSRVIAVTGACAMAVAVGALPAAADSTVVALNSAELLARGAAIEVGVSVTCDPYTDVWGTPQTSTPVQVTVNQAVKKGFISTSSGDATAACDGQAHALHVVVYADDKAFIRGPALVSVTANFNNWSTQPQIQGAPIRVR